MVIGFAGCVIRIRQRHGADDRSNPSSDFRLFGADVGLAKGAQQPPAAGAGVSPEGSKRDWRGTREHDAIPLKGVSGQCQKLAV